MLRPHSPSMSLKLMTQFQSMFSSSRIMRMAVLCSFCWAVSTWLFVALPFQDLNLAYRMNEYQQNPPEIQQQQKQQGSWRHVAIDDEDSFSSCLLVMDDNHFLIEWMAYHYHTLPLRYLVVAVDPRSQTSPTPILDRWRDKMTILEWQDEDYMTNQEIQEAEDIVRGHFGNLTSTLVRHRARQRVFYYKCMKKLKEDGRSWTLLTDTDEFLRINAEKSEELHLRRPDDQVIKSMRKPASVRSLMQAELARPGNDLAKSPCVQIPRVRFGAVDSGKPPMNRIPSGFDVNKFLTLRWRKHAGSDQYWANRISKVLIDVSQVDWNELVPVESIHRPIKSLCSQRKLHIRSHESVLVINHYLGSWDQYQYRRDARLTDERFGDGRSRQQYNKLKKLNSGTNDELRSWLQGFVEIMGESKAKALLHNVGVLQPKSSIDTSFMPKPADGNERCAIMFFGLPRSFKDLVLPSLEKNLIVPNSRYNCDYFVHYYYRTEEPEGRANNGGKLNPEEILMIEDRVRSISSRTVRKVNRDRQVVEFKADTEDDFWAARNDTIQKYRSAKDKDGNYLYFPWKAVSYHYPSSLDNIVRQWHSISSAWSLMEESAAKRGVQYSRVGMFRSDVLYVTPTDIYQTENGVYDVQNSQAVLAPFGAMPVNDRMFYGPYEAVEIWATKRFPFLESYVHTCEPGWAMHSEKFLNGAIMPAIRELGIGIVVNPDICFLRTRADFSAVTTDCHLMGTTRGFVEDEMNGIVEQILDRPCSDPYKVTGSHTAVRCEPS